MVLKYIVNFEDGLEKEDKRKTEREKEREY